MWTESRVEHAFAGTPLPPACRYGLLPAVEQGVRLPANTPALPIVANLSGDATGTLEARSSSAGVTTVVETDPRSGGLLLRASPGFPAANALLIAWTGSCSAPDQLRLPTTTNLQFTEAKPWPERLGTFDIVADGERAVVSFDAAVLPFVAVLETTAAVGQLRLGSGYHGPATTKLLVGGAPFGSAPHDEAKWGHPQLFPSGSIAAHVCGEAREGVRDYALRIEGHIAGASDDLPSLSVVLKVDCRNHPDVLAASRGSSSSPSTSGDTADTASCALSRRPVSGSMIALGFVLVVVARFTRRGQGVSKNYQRTRCDQRRRCPSSA